MSRSMMIAVFLCSMLGLAACGLLGGHEVAPEDVSALALPRGFVARPASGGLTAYERVRSEGQVAAAYIEGDDGSALGLKLALKDVSPNVVYLPGGSADALMAALDDIKTKYKFFGFNLVGYSSGAAVAAEVAAKRSDVLSLRTVDGKLGDATSIAAQIVKISQKHFVGANDDAGAGESFITASGRPDCLSLTKVDGASKAQGWEEKWAELLEQPLEGGCQ